MTKFEDREPTTQEVLFALKCNGFEDCDDCYYKSDRPCFNCFDAARKDAATIIEKAVTE
ncbi:MAG: hypothetical protein IJ308_08500 [Clostridia bacterium]|nr:hypothetical protein [Clostridia bacterium]